MKLFLRLYLRIFLYTTILFGIYNFLMDQFWPLGNFNKHYFIFPIFMGVFMSLYLGTYQWYRYRKQNINALTYEDLLPRQKSEFTSPLSINELYELIKNDEHFEKMKFSKSENQISIKSGMSFTSWGERIIIDLIENLDQVYKYKFISKPKIYTTFVDYGKNYFHKQKLLSLVNN